MTATVTSPDGRTIGFDDQEPPDGTAVLWCHGGPGSRLEPVWLRDEAVAAGLRIVGVDRPGYGLSTPRPGRTIADTVADLLAVADHLAIEQFVTVGVSTGGAYRARNCCTRTESCPRRRRVLCRDRHGVSAGARDDARPAGPCRLGRTQS